MLCAKALRGAATHQAGLLRRLARNRLFKQPALAAEALEDLHAALSRLLDATVLIASDQRYVEPAEVRASPALVTTDTIYPTYQGGVGNLASLNSIYIYLNQLGGGILPDPHEVDFSRCGSL